MINVIRLEGIHKMIGFGIFTSLIALVVYIGIPVAIIFLLMWIYRIKVNSDLQVEQNKEIIRLLESRDE